MDFQKEIIQQKLIANELIDKCKQCNYIIFYESWCSQERVVRFTTSYFRTMFAVDNESTGGKWGTGDYVMFELHNQPNLVKIDCVFSAERLDYSLGSIRDALYYAFAPADVDKTEFTLKTWVLNSSNIEEIFVDFDKFLLEELSEFEKEVVEKLADPAEPNHFYEGKDIQSYSHKYERNPKAREACIKANGTACKICGIDFGKIYGPEFAGRIEVHHIVPISQIGHAYEIDPVKDLIPICPNCHAAIHSKKGGFYTVEELKALLLAQKS